MEEEESKSWEGKSILDSTPLSVYFLDVRLLIIGYPIVNKGKKGRRGKGKKKEGKKGRNEVGREEELKMERRGKIIADLQIS